MQGQHSPQCIFRWGLKHHKFSIKLYTVICIIWLAFWALVVTAAAAISGSEASALAAYVIIYAIFAAPFLIPLYLLRRRESGKTPEQLLNDPYLIAAVEKLHSIERYCRGDVSVAWGPVVTMAHDALMSVMHKMLIDAKGAEGVKILEQWRAERKLNLSTFIRTLKEWGLLVDDEVKELEILRDLRNRVVHEDYHPSREQALWAYNLVKRFVKSHYPSFGAKITG